MIFHTHTHTHTHTPPKLSLSSVVTGGSLIRYLSRDGSENIQAALMNLHLCKYSKSKSELSLHLVGNLQCDISFNYDLVY